MRGCNVGNAGPNREWRPEGAPTTEEALLVSLQANVLSIVLLSSVLCPLQKKKKKDSVQIEDDIAAFLDEQ